MKFISEKIKNNFLYINTTILILIVLLSFAYGLLFHHIELEKYINWLFLIILSIVFYFMVVKLEMKLVSQWMVGVILITLEFSICSYMNGSTVNWTEQPFSSYPDWYKERKQ